MKRRVLQSMIIPKGEGRALEVLAGQVLRIIEIDGKQVADVTFLNLHDPREGYHAGQSLALNLLLGTGSLRRLTHLYSKPPRENVMVTVIDDPVGVHWAWNGGRCSRTIYRIRDGIESGHRTCQENLAEAIRPWGLTGDDVPDVFNIFMNTEILNDETLLIKPPVTQKGDYIDLRAEMDVIAAISACPGDTVPTNDFDPKRLQIEAWIP